MAKHAAAVLVLFSLVSMTYIDNTHVEEFASNWEERGLAGHGLFVVLKLSWFSSSLS